MTCCGSIPFLKTSGSAFSFPFQAFDQMMTDIPGIAVKVRFNFVIVELAYALSGKFCLNWPVRSTGGEP
jgi:hypothetical protein